MQCIIVMVGIPASGKTTLAHKIRQQAAASYTMVESDAIRLLAFAEPTYSREENRHVFALVRQRVCDAVMQGKSVIVDATNVAVAERRVYIGIAKKNGIPVHAVFLDLPISECAQRNEHRAQGRVPEMVIFRSACRLVPPTEQEGFSSVTVI